MEGQEWGTDNGLAQGCPASPDLLNILLEPFHCWTAASGMGITFEGVKVASANFAHDLCLTALSFAEVEQLVEAYQLWCQLLGLKVNIPKTQIWSNRGGGQRVWLAGQELVTRDTFRMVGNLFTLKHSVFSRFQIVDIY